ncbi:DUF1286 domain-containing protein [Stygiolobus azoricus]|uniref:DUF1286 domain-containing protein n=1 Tax=Stygiolobus azoricus TaxID=41675 RepID=A0A650CLA5_9CREN|nr:DUF1286 domain-containing protein [Stygiolobus azoricus]QGR18626.1 DUF1286 domain-containing protein [Stygiolobus azoricus]
MKLQTHYVFSLGLLTFLDTLLVHHFYTSLFFSGVVSVLGNTLIDRLGHEVRSVYGKEIIKRTPLTHTLPRSVIWGFIPALLLSLLYYYIYEYVSEELLSLALVSLLNGPSHMLLDVFTERGIYVKRNGKWRRFALAHFSYNNPAVNGLAFMLGVLMLFASYYIGGYSHYYYYRY